MYCQGVLQDRDTMGRVLLQIDNCRAVTLILLVSKSITPFETVGYNVSFYQSSVSKKRG